MKTIFLSLVLIGISYFSLKSLVKSFKGESKCSGCPSAKTCKVDCLSKHL
jgi:hypothetical protein